ncbi:MAG: 7-cyano-7-deazaguanine synthase [Candidatus Woesearchaeota archaeon]
MKAVALLSGGLDSILACKTITSQGIEVTALSFTTPFFKCPPKKVEYLERVCKSQGIKLIITDITKDYIKILRKPEHGYGKNLNPCIDCKILMLKKAKQYAKKIGAKFIFTGEVLGQRPMSQHLAALHVIENSAGLKGKLLRPLCAKHLKPTEAELKGYVNRELLHDMHGRDRNQQLRLAKSYGIKEYQSPAGGCLLTCEDYCKKVKDMLNTKKKISIEDIELLKIGRHYKIDGTKIYVGRNKADNDYLQNFKSKRDMIFIVPNHGSPITILRGKHTKEAIALAAQATARFSDAPEGKVIVKYGIKEPKKAIAIEKTGDVFNKFRI